MITMTMVVVKSTLENVVDMWATTMVLWPHDHRTDGNAVVNATHTDKVDGNDGHAMLHTMATQSGHAGGNDVDRTVMRMTEW